MSFKKILTCSRCQLTSSVEDEKFPEDLYALLIKYSLSQILWICKPCYKEDNLTSIESMHHVDDEIKLLNAKFKKMESDISEIKSVIQKLQLVTNDNFATTFKHELKRMEEFNFDKNSPKICSLLGYNQNVNSYKEEISGVDSDSSITSEENQKNLNTFDVIDGCKRTNLHSSSTPKNNRNENIQLFSLSANYQTEDSLSSSFSCSGSLDSNSKILAEANTSQKRNKEAHKIIHEIVNAKIKIDDEESTKSSNIVDVFLKTITPALKKIDPVFNIMYERDYKTGSSYTDLRISEASEYDIDIVLKTPSEIRLEVEFFEATRAFSKIKWSKVSDLSENKMEVLKFLQKNSVDGYVDPVKMTSWLQGLIDVYLKTEPVIPGVKLFKSTQSGPARTIELVTNEDYIIHIDLVPVFMFSNSALVETPIKNILDTYPAKKSKQFWFLVPKQCRGEEKLLASDCKLSWRVCFPEVEKVVIHNKMCAKTVIKLLKLLRDNENWKSIASYYLKTLILWEVHANPDNDHWKGSVLFDRFLEALKKLHCCLQEKRLSFFFDPSYNLFHVMNGDQCKNWSFRLKKIITSVESDPANLKNYFLN